MIAILHGEGDKMSPCDHIRHIRLFGQTGAREPPCILDDEVKVTLGKPTGQESAGSLQDMWQPQVESWQKSKAHRHTASRI